jgi:hypothetical protein
VRPVRIPGAMGSLTCEHIMRQSPSGKWTWVETCYCSDPARAADTSAPFATSCAARVAERSYLRRRGVNSSSISSR